MIENAVNEKIRCIHAETAEQLAMAHELFVEYAASVGNSTCFQNFDKEVSSLPGDYTAPAGRLLLAVQNGQAAGCVALRKIADTVCEMKRLYVRPTFRGKGIGKRLANVIIEEAHRMGYSEMRLDTLLSMKAAIALYRSLGFKDITPYHSHPIDETIFMSLSLH